MYGRLVEETGAVIMGRRSYDNGIAAWGGKGPLGEVPCFVVTHRPPASADPVFTFVLDGIESALAKAQEVAGDKRIALIGAELDQQYLAAGAGGRDQNPPGQRPARRRSPTVRPAPAAIRVGTDRVTETHGVTHLEYHVRR